ncbi:helix-turn-helix domain-containing protein [Leuconostoc citreum]|uniref:helix-turn-helix domain-containing protein n=1 Tax=Leuconostoc citreum TaxID=33964 RepID=UPI002151660D|nr:helix-turn-helix transcriptional regulator [Leuconostoc citreum]
MYLFNKFFIHFSSVALRKYRIHRKKYIAARIKINLSQYHVFKESELIEIIGSFNNNFSENLAFLRKSNRMTRRDLAEKLHVSQTTVARYEEGTRMPDINLLIQIKDVLNTTCDDLLL